MKELNNLIAKMSFLSPQDFYAQLVNGKILYFPCDTLNTEVPHYFIIVTILTDGDIILSCGTSQFETVSKLIERKRFPEETLVFIPHKDSLNPFKLDTYINCNEYFVFTAEQLYHKYLYENLKIKGDLPLEYYIQMHIGFTKSRTIEVEIKESLPDINTL